MACIVPSANYIIQSVDDSEIKVLLFSDDGRKIGDGPVMFFPSSSGVYAVLERNDEQPIFKLDIYKEDFLNQCWNYRNKLDKSNRL